MRPTQAWHIPETAGVVLDGDGEGYIDLTKIVFAGGTARFFFRGGEGREQKSSEDGDDRDDHEQFDEREGGRFCFSFPHTP